MTVLGDSKLGLLCTRVLTAGSPCVLTLIGKHANKLGMARRWGLRVAYIEESPLRAFDVVVERTGSQAGLEPPASSCARAGRRS